MKKEAPKSRVIAIVVLALLVFVLLVFILLKEEPRPSPPAKAPPAPTGLIAEDIIQDGTPKCSVVKLRWNASPDPDVIGYNVYRNGRIVIALRVHTSAREGMFPLGDTTYSYQISAVNNLGQESELSAPVSYTTFPCHLTGRLPETNMAVILVKFADTINEPFSNTYVNNVVFNDQYSVKNYYDEVSYGRHTITGQTYGWYQLSGSLSDYCNSIDAEGLASQCTTGILAEAIDLASSDIDFDTVDRSVFVIDRKSQAGIGGAITVQLSAATGFRFTSFLHELGHGFELHHAGSWGCSNTNNFVGPNIEDLFQGTCTSQRYGDFFDPMGGGKGHYSSYNKEKLGYLIPEQIATADQTGEYLIDVLELPSNGIKELRIPLTGEYFYFLEYRKPIGFDGLTNEDVAGNDFIGEVLPVDEGVQIRLHRASTLTPSGQDQGDTETALIKTTLTPTNSFYDPYRDIRVSVIEMVNDQARVLVEYDVADTTPPTVSLTSPMEGTTHCCSFLAEATASDDFQVNRVEFYVDGTLFKSIWSTAYRTTINLVAFPDGNHQLTARAIDTSGNINEDSINFVVEHGPDFFPPTFETTKLLASDGGEDDNFGKAVAY